MPSRAPVHRPYGREARQDVKWAPDRERGTRQERGYGATWQRTRKQVLQRDDHLCQVCHANGLLKLADEVDHIIPKAQGGTDEIENLQAICKPCHRSKTAQERRPGGGGLKV